MLSEKRIKEITEAIGTKQDRMVELVDMAPADAAAKLNSEGFQVTADELIEFADFAKKSAESGELDEDALENVSGGIAGTTLFLIGTLGGLMLAKKGIW